MLAGLEPTPPPARPVLFGVLPILEAGTCHGVVERPLRAKTTPAGMYVLLERAPQVAERHISSVADDVF